MRILFIGDIFGKPGRDIARRAIPALVELHALDLVIANVENSAAGFGVTGDIADTILGYGVDVMTTGNHVWDKKEILDYIPRQAKLLRPANYPSGVPGRGSYIAKTRTGESVGVINVMGRVFMTPLDDPFAGVLREVEAVRAKARVIIVDFHAEATSEKVAMGWHLDGKVTGVVGMTGPHESIIGVTVEAALGRFLNSMPARFESATGPGRLNAVIVTADPATGKAIAIERLNMSAQEVEALPEPAVRAR
jgi:calcineurin-like phosphoesterase